MDNRIQWEVMVVYINMMYGDANLQSVRDFLKRLIENET